MDKELIFATIESLYPRFDEYADNGNFHRWMDYACELDNIMHNAWSSEPDALVAYINKRLSEVRSGSSEHDACIDVASNLEESTRLTGFKGVFLYE